ncbi:MAG: type II toxin-antitoxin system RelB/DinJ family antitoxin [Pseudoflavonifractor sp.]
MAQNSLIQVRVDGDLKQQADFLFQGLGLDTPTAIRMFLTQAVSRRSLPFRVIEPDGFYSKTNMEHLKASIDAFDAGTPPTVKTMEELEEMAGE